MKEIKRIDAVSLAKIYALFGLLMGIIAALFGFAIGSFLEGLGGLSPETEDLEGIGQAFGGLAAISYLIFYPLFAFISGLITGWLYNLFAGWVGGIKWEPKE